MCRSTYKTIIHRQLFYKLFYVLHIEVIDLYFDMEFMTFQDYVIMSFNPLNDLVSMT